MLYDVEVMLDLLVVPTPCIKSVLEHKASNYFLQCGNTSVYLHHPYKYSCSFCLGDYSHITHSLNRNGVCMVLMNLFSGGKRISGGFNNNNTLITR